ncbi:hypothetical protein SteCoe_3798 [Stentor coeruleus]|uniref:Serine aminopeptidase S33 domain-containing protein n=1 Tax=Stentor coeruleus TaxID=5963 RepID=A0A1R2CW37_9CILI|nr:hypothetical protein SteCoe_3798 [Stentor coeruleus]
MSEWWTQYVGKVQNAGVFFPEENWLGLTSVNGLKLMTYRFHRDIPKALVFIFHGMFGESNESSHVAKFLYNEGYAVLSMEQEGHGKSEGKKGAVGSYRAMAHDSMKFIHKAIKFYPDSTPIFLIGFSMGGTITAMLSLLKPEIISGILLLAPALGVHPEFEPFLRKIVRCLNCCCGCLKLKKFDGNLLSRNTDYIKYIEINPYTYSGKMSVRTAVNTLDGLNEIQEQVNNITVPVVLIQGGVDKIVSADMNENFIKDCKSRDAEYWFYENMFHDIYHEPEINEIMDRCVDWINSRLPHDEAEIL